MKMKVADFFFSILFGMFLAVVLYANFSPNIKVLDECEASLPRNQRCLLIAVPKEVK
jgi:hypothetical protein